MRAFNPRSAFHRSFRIDGVGDLLTKHFLAINVKLVQNLFARVRIEEEVEWNRDSWHNGRYPRGIPPFDSDQFLKKMWTGNLWQDVSATRWHAFDYKLKKWMGRDDGNSSDSENTAKQE